MGFHDFDFMGIYDRDYYREGSPASEAALFGRCSAMKTLLVVNVAVFFVWLIAHVSGSRGFVEFMFDNFTVSVEGIRSFRIWTLITYAFSHIDIWHILFNMLFLWFFGQFVEEWYGPRNLVFLYVASALTSVLLYLGLDSMADMSVPMLGASGSVMSFTVVAAFLHPNRVIRIWGVIPIQLKWLALVFVVVTLLGMAGEKRSVVADSAHLGGAVMGFFFYQFDLRLFDRRGRSDPFRWLRGLFRRKPKLRVVPPPERREEEAEASRRGPDRETAARVDELLAKINREGGIQSLTPEEKRFLEQASRQYKK